MNLVLALCVGANIIAGVGIIIYAVKNWFAKSSANNFINALTYAPSTNNSSAGTVYAGQYYGVPIYKLSTITNSSKNIDNIDDEKDLYY